MGACTAPVGVGMHRSGMLRADAFVGSGHQRLWVTHTTRSTIRGSADARARVPNLRQRMKAPAIVAGVDEPGTAFAANIAPA